MSWKLSSESFQSFGNFRKVSEVSFRKLSGKFQLVKINFVSFRPSYAAWLNPTIVAYLCTPPYNRWRRTIGGRTVTRAQCGNDGCNKGFPCNIPTAPVTDNKRRVSGTYDTGRNWMQYRSDAKKAIFRFFRFFLFFKKITHSLTHFRWLILLFFLSFYRFSAFWLRSKCSICSYQLNIWYVPHRGTTILNWFLERGQDSGACSGLTTGWPGIAVPPGTAHKPPPGG